MLSDVGTSVIYIFVEVDFMIYNPHIHTSVPANRV